MNHPQATYQAEIKPYQLHLAQKMGFDVPQTIISNASEYGASQFNNLSDVIIKTLDPIILKSDQREAFIYTNRISVDELLQSNTSGAPIVIQEPLIPKVDLRVTVVRDKVFAITIKHEGQGIDVDWRVRKEDLQYERIHLPAEVEAKCKAITKALHLAFGAIDLAYCNGKYYFLEINPTGEWAWLVDSVGAGIDEEISTALIEGIG
jgi:glutathione synthase/RimK-type ligase-like ATP-grasp enzyme